MRYICESAEIINQADKNQYIQLTFKSHVNSVGQIFIANSVPTVRMAMSGGYFTADNKPDKAKNLQWCRDNAPLMQGQEAEIERIPVECEPYYRITENKLVKDAEGKPIVFTEIGVNCIMYLDEATGEYRPAMSESQLKRQAVRMVNTLSGYKTVASYKQQLAAKQKAAEAIAAAQQAATQQTQQNPFTQGNGAVIDDLPM